MKAPTKSRSTTGQRISWPNPSELDRFGPLHPRSLNDTGTQGLELSPDRV